MNEAENIKAYFTENRRKLVSVKAVEAMAGVPRNTLLNLLTVGRAIPEHHLENIVGVLCILGYRPTREYNIL